MDASNLAPPPGADALVADTRRAWIGRLACARLATADGGDLVEPLYVRPPDITVSAHVTPRVG